MNIKSRDESISSLSEKLSKEQLHRAITQGYSNISLSVISYFKGEYAAMFFDSKYSANTVNKLINAYSDDKIDTRDLGRVDTTAQRPPYKHLFRFSALIFLEIRAYSCGKLP